MKSEMGFIRRYTSYLSRIRLYEVGVVVLVAAVMFTIGWTIGRSSLTSKLDEVTTQYELLRGEYEALQAEQNEDKSEPQEKVIYTKRYVIDTAHIAAASVKLGKGEVFEARMSIVGGSLIFYVRDPRWRKVVDAGRIEGEYEFAFEVEESGEYQLIFDDREGHRTIYLDYNSPSSLQDASVIP